MKNLLTNLLLISTLFFAACTKDTVTTDPQAVTSATSSEDLSKVQKTKWGTMLAYNDFTLDQRIQIAKSLKVKYIRLSVSMETWNGSSNEYETFERNGFKILLNLCQENTSKSSPSNWTKDTSGWRNFVASVLNKYKPEVVVIDNEEINIHFHTDPPNQYFVLLGIAIQEAHKRNLKITNGGLPVFTEANAHWNPYYNTALKAYSKMPLDFVNFHLKYPLDAPLRTMLRYMYKSCGYKPLMTNESGMFGSSIDVLNKEMDETQNLKIPYSIWYSVDTNNGLTALQNKNTSLRPTGTTFRDRMY